MMNLKKINYYSLILFILILPFSSALCNILFAIFCISSFTSIYKNDLFKIKKNKYPTYIFFILFGFIIINGLIQGSYIANKTLWKFIPILTIGSLVISYNKSFSLDIIKKSSIISCICFVSLCILKTILFYIQNNFIPFANEHEMVDILLIHRPYLGFYVLLNIILSFDLFIKSDNLKYKYIFAAIITSLVTFLILITARLSIISFGLIALIYIFFYLKLNLFKKIMIGFISIISFLFILSISPNIQERLNHNNLELMIDYEPRFVIWKSINEIKNNEDFNLLLGYGNYNLIEDYLVLNYDTIIDNEGKRSYFLNERFNTHSQYLDYFLFGGIPAVLIFSIFCLYSLWITKQDFIKFAIILSFILFFAVENVFHRQLGCYLFVLYYFLALKNNKKLKPIYK